MILVSWTAPYSLDGVPILGYNVTVSGVHTGVSTALASSTSIELELGNSCDNFTITVVPLNAVGNGLPAMTTIVVIACVQDNAALSVTINCNCFLI